MRRAEKGDRRQQRGTVMVVVALAATALLLFAAYAIDVGLVWSSRTQSQNAADSAALAAAKTMLTPDGKTVQIPTAEAEAQTYAAANSTIANPSVTVESQDITFGYYNLPNRTFIALNEDPTLDPTNPNHVRAARVDVRMDGSANEKSPTFFSALAGRDGFDVTNTAIAYLGFEGSWADGDFDLPIAIDSCDLVSDPSGCGRDFCATVANPPNPCPLDDPQAGDGDVTCLEFSSTDEQNACWTVFDGSHPSVNNPDLQDIIDNGNPSDTQAGDEVFLDNGDKTSTQAELKDKFEGTGDYAGTPAGEDRYPPYHAPPKSDSWVVKLPVVECQDQAHCAGGGTYAITGGVCFQIREITGPPDRLIKGKFLCPEDPDPDVQALWQQYCAPDPNAEPSGPGGCNFGFSAKTVVLVK